MATSVCAASFDAISRGRHCAGPSHSRSSANPARERLSTKKNVQARMTTRSVSLMPRIRKKRALNAGVVASSNAPLHAPLRIGLSRLAIGSHFKHPLLGLNGLTSDSPRTT